MLRQLEIRWSRFGSKWSAMGEDIDRHTLAHPVVSEDGWAVPGPAASIMITLLRVNG